MSNLFLSEGIVIFFQSSIDSIKWSIGFDCGFDLGHDGHDRSFWAHVHQSWVFFEHSKFVVALIALLAVTNGLRMFEKYPGLMNMGPKRSIMAVMT
jgi:hypothetical protein